MENGVPVVSTRVRATQSTASAVRLMDRASARPVFMAMIVTSRAPLEHLASIVNKDAHASMEVVTL